MSIVVIVDRCRALLIFALWLALAAYLAFFAAHVVQMLAYPFPLDYGEGPLLAQIGQLRAGIPIWQLYTDPAAPPYLVVNYPPVYLLATQALSFLTGNILLAGRMLSFLATLASVWALILLTRDTRDKHTSLFPYLLVFLSPCLLLSIPVVREWAGYLRVDALALCLGLWGLVALRYGQRIKGYSTTDRGLPEPLFGSNQLVFVLLAGVLFVLALYTKPSLLAAPAAGSMWWLLKGQVRWSMRIGVLTTWAVVGLVPFALLQWASGGWFWLHVVTANANHWDATLASQFWTDQVQLRWPLFIAAAFGLLAPRNSETTSVFSVFRSRFSIPNSRLLPLLYTLVGALTAVGVGKVGAYTNYFLELYVGLVWLACLGVELRTGNGKLTTTSHVTELGAENRESPTRQLHVISSLLSVLFLLLSMGWYSPMWSRDKLRPAGLLEPNPPQPAFARNGLWRETIRERQVLGALGRVQGALVTQVQAAGGAIFTDTPGIAAEAGVSTPLQAFEHRQLLDNGHWNQRDVLLGLANGTYPLAVIDFLGNWLTPEMITILTHRYAQDGSIGVFDLYRPVDPGPAHSLNLSIDDLRLVAYHLAAPNEGGSAYAPGELVPLALEWQRTSDVDAQFTRPITVVVQLTDNNNTSLLETTHSLIYGALPPDKWPIDASVQHLEALALPKNLPPGDYQIAVTLRAANHNLAPSQIITRIIVSASSGQSFETGYYVPALLLQGWEHLGGIERAGLPLTPAVRFDWGTLQCFELLCLEQRGLEVTQRPLGDIQYLGETLRNEATELREPFLSYWRTHGGETGLGLPISGEIARNGYIVQWTRYARLERTPEGTIVALGRLGDDSLRMPPGMKYRWPLGE